MNHPEAAELLGAYALDAVDGGERSAVEAHLRECRACQDELAEHHDAVGFLTPGWVPAPERVWTRIAGSLDESPPALQLAPVPPGPSSPSSPSSPPPRRWKQWRLAVAAAAACVVAVVGALSYTVVDQSRRIDRMEAQAPAGGLDGAIAAARASASTRTVELRSGGGGLVAEALIQPDGTGYLVPAALPAVSPNRTYQLWALVDARKISVGVLGPAPGPTAFTSSGDLSGLAITDEPAGGVVASDRQPVGLGTVA